MPIVRANGININFEERGQGEPLILIMGLGADGSVWELDAQAYEQHFRCILMDNRGAGFSDKPAGPYTTEMMADDTAGLLDALGIKTTAWPAYRWAAPSRKISPCDTPKKSGAWCL